MKTPFRAVLALAAILALSGCQKTADAAFGQKVRAYLLEHPEVIEEAVQKLQEKKVADAANLAKAGMVKHRKALERDPRDFVANPGGKITVVGSDVQQVTLDVIHGMQEQEEGDTLTILAGSDLDDGAFKALCDAIQEAEPDLEIDSHRGEQPLYPIVFSIE